MITGGARMTSLTAEIEAGEVAIIKYLASCYRRAFEECKKWKVCSIIDLNIFISLHFKLSTCLNKSLDGTHLYYFCRERSLRVKCLAEEYDTMTLAKVQTQTARSTVQYLHV